MGKFIDFGSGEVTQGDGWFEMPYGEKHPDGAFKVNIEIDPLVFNQGVGRRTWWWPGSLSWSGPGQSSQHHSPIPA